MRTFAVRLLQPSALFILLFVVEIQWVTCCRFFQNITCFPSIEPSQFGVPAHFKIIDQVAQIYQIAFHVSGTTVGTVDLCLVEGNLSVKDVGAGEFLGVQRIFGQCWVSHSIVIIWYIPALGVPQLGVMFLADCNSWGVNGTPNFKTETDAQNYWASWILAMFLHSPAYFSWVIKNQILSTIKSTKFSVCKPLATW